MKELCILLMFGGVLPHLAAQGTVADHLRKATEYLQANHPADAAREFTAVLALDPRNSEANANLGVIAFFQHDYKGASQYLRNALAVDSSLAKTEALLGICERRLGQPAAQAHLEESFPKLKDKNLRIQTGMELAGVYSQEGNLDGTASVMHSLVDLDPDDIEILYMAQRVYSDLADQTMNKLAILGPDSARMQQVIAERLINEGDLQGATVHYRKALELNPRLPGVHYELAEALLEAAPHDPRAQSDSEKELESAIQLDGASARTECMFARIALQRLDMDGAYTHYSRAFAMNSGDSEAQYGLGRLLAIREKPDEALKYLRMAVQSDPLNEQAHFRLARVCKSLQLTDEAAREIRLFQEIQQTKDRVRELYRQMNKKAPGKDDRFPDTDK